MIKRSKEQSRTADDQKRLRERKGEVDGKGKIRLEWSLECGGCLRVRMKTEKCELWGM